MASGAFQSRVSALMNTCGQEIRLCEVQSSLENIAIIGYYDGKLQLALGRLENLNEHMWLCDNVRRQLRHTCGPGVGMLWDTTCAHVAATTQNILVRSTLFRDPLSSLQAFGKMSSCSKWPWATESFQLPCMWLNETPVASCSPLLTQTLQVLMHTLFCKFV